MGTAAAAPVPARLSTPSPLLALEARVSVALRAPTMPGVKAKVTLQLAPTARELPALQVPLRMKSLAAVPVSVRALKVNVAAPLLLTVTVWLALVLPTVCAANVSVAAFNAIAGSGVAVPVPLSETPDGEPTALCVIERFALRAPLAAGVNAILSTQDPPAAMLAPAVQVLPVAI